VRVATVAGAFPSGAAEIAVKIEEITGGIAEGADEIDVVMDRRLAQQGDWRGLFREVCAFRMASKDKVLKVILGTGDLRPEEIGLSSTTALAGGADFIKTSTGSEKVNATLEAGKLMCEALRDHRARSGQTRGIKPAGGIRTAAQAIEWMDLVGEILGEEWLNPRTFRIGTSGITFSEPDR
jgi:deoxyribose-phosphate aldolase